MAARLSDEKAARFEDLYRETYESVVAYCRRRARSFHEAEEVVSATFLVAWRRFDDFTSAELPLAWLYAVAYRNLSNQRRGWHRRSALKKRLQRERTSSGRSPEREAEAQLEVSRAFEALETLSSYDQEIIRLAAFEGLAYEAIGVAVGKSVDAVRSDMFRARQRLRTAFNGQEGSSWL